jgi:uncharacterized protein
VWRTDAEPDARVCRERRHGWPRLPGMPASSLSLPRTLGLGLAAGLLAGLFGVGGGVVLVPGMVLLMGLAQHVAHATSLVAILVTAPAAVIGFALDGSVAYAAGGATAVGAMIGAFGGAAVMHRISPTRLRQGFALLLVLVAVRMALPIEVEQGAAVAADDPLSLLAFAGLGLSAGVLSAIMGVGGGVIMVPAFVLLFGLDQHTAEGTSLLVIVPTALMGAYRHGRHDYTDWRLGLLIGAGGVLGGLVGAQIAIALPGEALQRLFAGFLLLTGVRMLAKSRPKTSEAA